jgi:L-alanine-DL-glutamate epimerase-like enolase superfamily enzyme
VVQGFKAIKLGWTTFGRRETKTDKLLVRTALDTIGSDIELMVDAGGSDAFWPHGFRWALRTAQMLVAFDVMWFEEPNIRLASMSN